MLTHYHVKLCPPEILYGSLSNDLYNANDVNKSISARLYQMRNLWKSQSSEVTAGERPGSEINMSFRYLVGYKDYSYYLYYGTRYGMTSKIKPIKTERSSPFRGHSGLFIQVDVLNKEAAVEDIERNLAFYNLHDDNKGAELREMLNQINRNTYSTGGYFPDNRTPQNHSYLVYFIPVQDLNYFADKAIYLDNLDLVLNLTTSYPKRPDLIPHPYSLLGLLECSQDYDTISINNRKGNKTKTITKSTIRYLVDKGGKFPHGLYYLDGNRIEHLEPIEPTTIHCDGVWTENSINDEIISRDFITLEDAIAIAPDETLPMYYTTYDAAKYRTSKDGVLAAEKERTERVHQELAATKLESERLKIENERAKMTTEELKQEQQRVDALNTRLENENKQVRIEAEKQRIKAEMEQANLTSERLRHEAEVEKLKAEKEKADREFQQKMQQMMLDKSGESVKIMKMIGIAISGVAAVAGAILAVFKAANNH